jgi:predicted amidohydrolase
MAPAVRTAAVQMEARLADIPANLAQAFDLAERALRAGAQYVALPEFFTTPVVLDERIHGCALPADNAARDALTALARQYGATLGGSYLEYEGGDVYNSYILACPDGAVHRHRKDLPTMAERAFYIGGGDRGLVELAVHSVGIAVCWETIRSATVRRLRGACDLVMSGSHWWSAPEWRFARRYLARHARLNADHMYRAPGRFARLVGAPLLHAAHAGRLTGRYALTPRHSVPMSTHLAGETQIVDVNGRILARRTAAEGAGVVEARVVIGRSPPPEPPPMRFWLEPLPPFVRLMWATQNRVCAAIYREARTRGAIVPYMFAPSGASIEPTPNALEGAGTTGELTE